MTTVQQIAAIADKHAEGATPEQQRELRAWARRLARYQKQIDAGHIVRVVESLYRGHKGLCTRVTDRDLRQRLEDVGTVLSMLSAALWPKKARKS